MNWDTHGHGSSGTRVLRGAERFRTPIGGVAVGQTTRVRRSVGGTSRTSALPVTTQPIETICAHCGQTFVVALRPGMGQVPCIHCGHLNESPSA